MSLQPFKKYTVTFGFLLLAQLLCSQNKPVVNYTTHNGLPQIQVRAVFQDSRGYIWAGTKSGLACFNGIAFTTFLPNETIEIIKERDNGDLFVKTGNNLYRFNGNSMHKMYESIHPFEFNFAETDVWIWNSMSLKHFKNDTLFQTFLPEKDLPPEGISNFQYDKKSGTCFCVDTSHKTIYKFTENKFQKVISAQNGTTISLDIFRNGPLCLLESDKEVIRVKNFETNDEYYRCYIQNKKIDSIRINYLPVPYQIYFFYDQYFKLDSATNKASKIELDMIKAPYPVIYDKDMNIWAGSDNGLYHVINGPFQVFDRSFMSDFWSLIKGNDGYFYGGSFKQGLFKLDFDEKQKKEIIVYREKNSKETDYYYGASKDKQGNLYFPGHFGTVKYNYRKAKKFDTGISLISKYDPYTDRIIIGQNRGIAFIDKNEKLEYFIDNSNALISHATCMEYKNDSIIWIGSGKSIAQFNRRTKQFSPLFSPSVSGPANGVIAMTKDHLNNIWLGGRDGLWLYRSTNNAFERVDKEMIKSNIAALISPNPDLLVIGTSREVYVLNLKKYYYSGELEMKLYNYHNGFIGEEVCQNGFFLDGENLIIPSTTITSVLILKQIDFNPGFNDVRITKINDNKLSHKQKTDPVLNINKGVNKLEFLFETVGFGLPTVPKFSYKLEGIEEEWSDWTTNNFANYSNLSSGEYVFHIISQAGNSISAATQKTDSIRIKISLPFYKEPDLYKVAFFIILLLSFLIIYFGWSRFSYKVKISEREQKIKYLEIATLQAQLNPHFIFNFLSSVQSLISTKKPEIANSYLVKFSRLMRAYMESSIKSSKILTGLSASNEITIADEIELLKMYIDLDSMKYEPGKITYEIIVSDNQLLNKTIPPMIIQPLVENAIKHGILPKNGNGHLKITFLEKPDSVECSIEDDGIGMEQSAVLQNQSIKQHHSRGIELINKKIEILNELDYKITIKYVPVPVGTSVTIYFNN